MYGYVRPERGELKVREYEQFRGVYCGLCHMLRKRYGIAYRFAVNYDFTFLAMLLAGSEPVSACPRRCPYHPLRRTACPQPFPGMEAAADYSVILAYAKLRDDARDRRFPGSILFRLLAWAVRPAYRKAAGLRPAFARTAEDKLKRLSVLEAENCASLDAAADTFASILQAAAEGAEDEDRRRVLKELLYHLGRIVYLLDAADDLPDDIRTGVYNPLRCRYTLQDGKLTPEDEAALRTTMQHSHNCISAAYALLEENPYAGILSNTIYHGLPAVTQAVFSGAWRQRNKKERSRL